MHRLRRIRVPNEKGEEDSGSDAGILAKPLPNLYRTLGHHPVACVWIHRYIRAGSSKQKRDSSEETPECWEAEDC